MSSTLPSSDHSEPEIDVAADQMALLGFRCSAASLLLFVIAIVFALAVRALFDWNAYPVVGVLGVLGGFSLIVGITFCLLAAMKWRRMGRRRLVITGLLITLPSMLAGIFLTLLLFGMAVSSHQW